MNPLFQRGLPGWVKWLLLAFLALLLLVADHRFHTAEPARSALSTLVAPFQYLINLPVTLLGWSSDSFRSHSDLLEENRQLREERLQMQARLQRLLTVEAENQRLKALLNAADEVEHEALIARMLAVDLDPYRQKIVINRGGNDGVYAGQPLIDANGVMGQITHVGPLTAEALLISDPSHAIPVRVVRNGLRSIAFGTGHTDRLQLRHLPNSADIEVGDLLVTSGLGGRFPANYPVATVTAVQRNPGKPFADVAVRPLAQLDRAQEVLLVRVPVSPPAEQEESAADAADGAAAAP